MKIALIGASGFVGSVLLKEALDRGHQVTAIVRNPEKVNVQHQNLRVVKGDVTNEHECASLVSGHDAVLSAFNAGWANPNLYADFLAGSQAILNGTKKAGVKRLLVVGGAGSLEVAPGLQLVDSPQFPEEWKSGAMAARDFLTVIRQDNELEWTFVSPAIMLEPGEATRQFRLGTDQIVFDEEGKSRITVADLAVAMLDVLENNQYIRQRFTLGY